MLSLLVDRYIKNPKLHNAIIKYSFFAFNGLTVGIVFNDVIRVLYGDFRDKNKVGYTLGAAGLVSGFIDKRLTMFSDPLNLFGIFFTLSSNRQPSIFLYTFFI